MRGKGLPGFDEIMNAGITPAYAGKRMQIFRSHKRRKDHPRVCGEKKLAEFEDETGEGSPPRMRGKDAKQYRNDAAWRITPAYAGKRWSADGKLRRSGDHPRVCGEKSLFDQLSLLYEGSPPRMRGKACFTSLMEISARITPAYAGKSSHTLVSSTF